MTESDIAKSENSKLSNFQNIYDRYAPRAKRASQQLEQLAHRYSARAKKIGYVPLTGIATVGGLAGLLLSARNPQGTIDPAKLPEQVREAFALQFPNKFEAGELSNLHESMVQPLLSGWVGKYAEILARDKLNSGQSLGGYRLADGEVAQLAKDPTQEGWDLVVNPSGLKFQVKATSDLGYIRDSVNELDDSGVIFITTELDDGSDLSDLGVLLLEMDQSKEELVGLISDEVGEATDALDDFGFLEDVLGPFALLVSAGTGAVLVKKAYDDYKMHGSMATIRRNYGSRVAGKIATMISPIPFTGLLLRKFIDTRMLLKDALNVAQQRLERVSRIARSLANSVVT